MAAIAVANVLQPFQNAPFVDDWAYAWSVENLLRHGRLEVLNYTDNFNAAQIFWGALFSLPLGFSFTALRVSTWVVSIAGLCGMYLLLRELAVPRRDALLGTATLGVYPVFAMLGVTFMTDVPFVSVTLLATFALVGAIHRRSDRWLIAAIAAAAVALGIREVGVATPVAMCLALLGNAWGRSRGRWAVVLTPLLVFGALVLWWQTHRFEVGDLTWVRGTLGDRVSLLRQFALSLLPRMLAETFALIAGIVGLAVLPISFACLRRQNLIRAVAIFAAVAGTLAALWAVGVRYPQPLMSGAVWSLRELGGMTALVPDDPAAPVSITLRFVALAVGAFSFSIALAVLWEAARGPSPHASDVSGASRTERGTGVRSFLVWAFLGHAGLIALVWLLYDRYALVLVPLAIALLLTARPRVHPAAAVCGLAVFLAVSLVGIRDHLAYNRALWSAVDILGAARAPRSEINGGYVVNGWLQYAHPEQAHLDEEGRVSVPWVNGGESLPYRISNAPPPGWIEMSRVPYTQWLRESGQLFVVRRPPPLVGRPIPFTIGVKPGP